MAAQVDTLSLQPAVFRNTSQRPAPSQTLDILEHKRTGNVTSISTRDRATGVSSAWAIGPATRKTIRGPSEMDRGQERRREGKRPFEGILKDALVITIYTD